MKHFEVLVMEHPPCGCEVRFLQVIEDKNMETSSVTTVTTKYYGLPTGESLQTAKALVHMCSDIVRWVCGGAL